MFATSWVYDGLCLCLNHERCTDIQFPVYIQNYRHSVCLVHADLGMASKLWASAVHNHSEHLLTLLIVFLVLGLTCFTITFTSLFWNIFIGKRGIFLQALMFSCEIGVLAVSSLSITEAIQQGTFQLRGTYQSDAWFLIFSLCMTVITTCLSIVGLERLISVARGVSNRLNIVMPIDAGLATWTSFRSKPLCLPEKEHEHLADQPVCLDTSSASDCAR